MSDGTSVLACLIRKGELCFKPGNSNDKRRITEFEQGSATQAHSSSLVNQKELWKYKCLGGLLPDLFAVFRRKFMKCTCYSKHNNNAICSLVHNLKGFYKMAQW